MPSNITGRRRVRCPKCTALLTEPQTQIYECPVCMTLLLAKGYGDSRLSGNMLYGSDRDAEGIQKIIDSGAKLEKASLIIDDKDPVKGESVEIEDSSNFERGNIVQPENNAPSNPNNPSLSGEKFSQSAAVPSKLSVGEVSPSHVSGHRSSDVDSASHSESEAYVDSPLWSSEKANACEVPEASSLLNSFDSSSFVSSSSEAKSTVTNVDCAERLPEEQSSGKDDKSEIKHQNTVVHQCTEGISHDNKVDCSYTTSLDVSDNGTAGNKSSKTPLSSLPGKEMVKGDLEDSQNDGDRNKTARVGKFRLFDLSVFGIYNEETYDELRRGKVAHYPSLAQNGNDNHSIQPPAENELGSHLSEIAAQDLSSVKDCFGAQTHEHILHVEKNASVLELPVINPGVIYSEIGDNDEIHFNASREDTETRSLDSVGKEAENAGLGSLQDENLLPVCDRDNDALAKAPYGDDLSVRELSSEATSVDISFGDWRSQQVPKSSHSALEPDPDVDFVYEKRMINLATEEDTDSSWDDDEDLTFLSTAESSSKLRGTDSTDEDAEVPPVTRKINGETQVTEKSAFSLRTTAMQKFLHRDDQQIAAQTQSSQSHIKVDSVLYEAPYVERFSPLLGKGPQDASDQGLSLVPEQEACRVLLKNEHDVNADALEDTEKETTEVPSWSLHSTHSSPASNMKNADASLTPDDSKEDDRRQVFLAAHVYSRNDVEMVVSLKDDGIMGKMNHTDLKTEALASQEADYTGQGNANNLGNVAAVPVSLRWKGKGSSTQSISSTEDEGTYGMDSEAGSGPEKDPFREESVGLIGRPFPDKEGKFASGQQPRDPAGRGTQRTWVGGIEANRPKSASGDPATSRRSARTRLSNERLSFQGPFTETDRISVGEKSSGSETSGRVGLDRSAERFPGYLGPGLNLNRDQLDQRSLYSGTADYNSEHSSWSQDVPPHSHYNGMSNSYGSASGANARVHPFQLPPHGSLALAASHEKNHSHLAHTLHCTCSVCIQQRYILQQSQMHQSLMLPQCAACAAQASAVYQPMHHEMHGHHMHGLTHLNPLLINYDPGVVPAQARKQDRSSVVQHNHPVLLARRMKHYPPLPGKGAAPYVLCRHCNQLLQVSKYLSPNRGSVQKMHCGACGKTSKFSISQTDNRAFGATMTDLHGFDARDKQHLHIPSVYSSGPSSSSGVVSSVQSRHGNARFIPGQGSQHAGVENRASSHLNAYGIPPTQSDFVSPRHQLRLMAGTPGSEQAPYGGHKRHINGSHGSNDSGLLNEDYFFSSPSSVYGASPGRHSQMVRDKEWAQPFVMGRPTPGDPKLLPSLPVQTIFHEHGRFHPEAPSFSDSLLQKGVSGAGENKSRVSGTSLQGSSHDPGASPRHTRMEMFDSNPSKGGNWHIEHADADYSGVSTPRSQYGQIRKLPVAPGSPLIEHFTHDAANDIPTAQHKHLLQSSDNDSRSTPWSPKSESQASPPYESFSQDAMANVGESDRIRPPLQDNNKGPKSFTGLLRRSIKDIGKGGQGGQGVNHRKVVVNGHLIPEAAVRKAEEQAGPIHSGIYWYDYQAGFWGVMDGPCLGILMPFIEEFHFPLARDCAGGKTGILVNGRELHDKDVEVLAKRGLPSSPGKAYILDISGALFDDVSGQPLKGLGKLAPSIEKRGRAFGMYPSTPPS